MRARKRIGLVAHDGRKQDLAEWVKYNEGTLSRHDLWASGTTGGMLEAVCPSLRITRLKSGPLGGDQQLGAMIAEERLDVLIFFTDPMTSQPHDVDVKALMRLSTVYNIVLALTRTTADFVIHSPLFNSGDYHPVRPDYAAYIRRNQPGESEARG
ncbi:methylglyoxal synthase [Oleispirillum naphthae]|uniref:methylglyoxal synthase n=1 Tax=Oleispirillum naphthae TaxID=2838853 RepID=UPI0030825168